MWHALAFLLVIGCAQKNGTTDPSEPVANEEAAPEPTDDETADDATTDGENGDAATPDPTPESLYAECEGRVEGPQKEGECEKDGDCKVAGCGTEVCTTVADAGGIMTTCEGRLCFKILDTCGCHDGQCTWTIKDEIPAIEGPKPAGDLPPTRLPPSPPVPAPAPEGGE